MSWPKTKPGEKPLTEPVKAFPDLGTLIAAMDKARADGDEALRALYNPRYEMSKANSEGWGTHMPVLASVVAIAPPGPILEIGVGRCSSPLLVHMCKAMGRELIGLDSEQSWLDEISLIGYQNLVHMPDWNKLPEWLKAMGDFCKKWPIVFVDHGPGDSRLPVTKMVRPYARQLVCHDTFNPGYLVGFDAYLDTFKYRYDFTWMPSSTSVVSDEVECYGGDR